MSRAPKSSAMGFVLALSVENKMAVTADFWRGSSKIRLDIGVYYNAVLVRLGGMSPHIMIIGMRGGVGLKTGSDTTEWPWGVLHGILDVGSRDTI